MQLVCGHRAVSTGTSSTTEKAGSVRSLGILLRTQRNPALECQDQIKRRMLLSLACRCAQSACGWRGGMWRGTGRITGCTCHKVDMVLGVESVPQAKQVGMGANHGHDVHLLVHQLEVPLACCLCDHLHGYGVPRLPVCGQYNFCICSPAATLSFEPKAVD